MSFSSNIEDYLNMELLSNPGGSSSSRSSSQSPTVSFSQLPQSPAQNVQVVSDADSLFNFHFDDDYLKTSDAISSFTSSPYDFMSSSLPHTSSGSPDISSAASSNSPSYQFAIDPQLVGTPASSVRQDDFADDENCEDDELGQLILPVKVGGKGKGRKGTVQSGGVTKRTTTAAVRDKDTDPDADDWRPTPEEYQKMSSKEKRQLRNKISARNFRVRRKEYITTLEGDIAERDRLIDAIRAELGTTKDENYALRQEVAALKKAIMEGRASPMLPPPAPLSPISPVARTSSPLITPNTQKDLPTSPRVGPRAFWGGSQSFGVTPVHTTLIPQFSISPILSGKSPLAPSPRVPESPQLQENMNPSLNVTATLLAQTQTLPHRNNNNMAPFDAFSEANPFTLKTLDAYRIRLWGRMATMQHQREQLAKTADVSSPALNGLAKNLRPHFFEFRSVGKNTAYPTPPSSPPTLKQSAIPTPQQALVADMATQSVAQKLTSAFWGAFSGSSSSGSSSPAGKVIPGWDAEKVRKVLEGTAVLQVVDIEPSKASSTKASTASSVSNTDALEESMRRMNLSQLRTSPMSEDKDKCSLFGILRAPGGVGVGVKNSN